MEKITLKIMIIGLIFVRFLSAEVPTTYRGFVANPYTQETIELAKKVGYLERANEVIERYLPDFIKNVKDLLSKLLNPDEKIVTRIQELENRAKNIFLEPTLETIGELINPNDALQSKINYLDQKWSNKSEISQELTGIYLKLIEQEYVNNINKINNYGQNTTDQVKSLSFSTRFNDFVSEHQVLAALGGITILTGVGYAVYNWYQKRQNAKQKVEKKEDDVLNDFINLT